MRDYANLLLKKVSSNLSEKHVEIARNIYNETFSEKEKETLPLKCKMAFRLGVKNTLDTIIFSVNKSAEKIKNGI